MKQAFDKAGVSHSEWISSSNKASIYKFFMQHKILIAKHKHSSKGKNIYYIDNPKSLDDLCNNVNIKDFVFEKYYFFPNEYRVHVDVHHGCFYACKRC